MTHCSICNNTQLMLPLAEMEGTEVAGELLDAAGMMDVQSLHLSYTIVSDYRADVVWDITIDMPWGCQWQAACPTELEGRTIGDPEVHISDLYRSSACIQSPAYKNLSLGLPI